MQRVVGLFDTQPRAAARLFWNFSCETAIYAERLISVSRRSAAERVAHFLLELHARMQKLGLADTNSFRLPLTQEILSDALGLSIPYVNRVLQQLKAEGLARIKDQEVVIEDMDALSALADFEQVYLTPLSLADFAPDAV
jgi:CRP-like cAMP-binding protein